MNEGPPEDNPSNKAKNQILTLNYLFPKCDMRSRSKQTLVRQLKTIPDEYFTRFTSREMY